jgi:LPPG:FO 2-phospho-L-lactate transferase
VATWVYTEEGELPFQEYFVRRQCGPKVSGFRFQGAAEARPAPGVVEFIRQADLILICPSNPWVSIDPIFAVPGIKAAVSARPVAAVSPIIGGQTVKGPAAKMYAELGLQPSALAVARHYGSLLSGFILDRVDAGQAQAVEALGIAALVTDTLMKSPGERQRLAEEVLKFGETLARGNVR